MQSFRHLPIAFAHSSRINYSGYHKYATRATAPPPTPPAWQLQCSNWPHGGVASRSLFLSSSLSMCAICWPSLLEINWHPISTCNAARTCYLQLTTHPGNLHCCHGFCCSPRTLQGQRTEHASFFRRCP